jgi:hypothetical protein
VADERRGSGCGDVAGGEGTRSGCGCVAAGHRRRSGCGPVAAVITFLAQGWKSWQLASLKSWSGILL